MRHTVDDLIACTQNQFSQTPDEIYTLRKHCSLLSNQAQPHIVEISDKSGKIQEDVKHSANTLLNCFKAHNGNTTITFW